MKKVIALIGISMGMFCLNNVQAQDAGNFVGTALDLSRTTPGGSARMLGIGEAQTSLGGDISSASSNPAGLGFFNKSEFSFTPAFNYLNTTSEYLGSSTSDARLNFNFSNLGAVIKYGSGSGSFKGGSFGISINRIADFQNQITYEGNSFNQLDSNGEIIFDPNRPADIVEYAALNAFTSNGSDISFDNDFAELAFETFLISPFSIDGNNFVDRDYYAVEDDGSFPQDNNGNDIFIPAYTEPDFPTFQTENIRSTGAMYQTSFSYGANFDDRIYFGGGIGLITMTREVNREYIEIPTNAELSSLVLEDNYEQNGTGVNATFGVIGRPMPQVLLGASYTTPSIISIEQIRSVTLTANYLFATNFREQTESFGFDYEAFNFTITTPSKLRAGATYFLGKSGFITGDIERINYAGANLSNSESGVSFSQANSDINQLESVINYRLGAEFRYEMFRLRAGFARMDDPVKNDIDESENRITFGGGIRTEDYFVDMAVSTSNGRNSTVSPYPGQVATVENKNTAVSFTVGFFF
ncbi:MAG: hypothetical protein RLO81_02010 [Fulvivirga sp.]|uniref:OmpP1/FadL family transporter n=1 Tax=Fulvivirga sp. TaxID=1931237 RepID=UPI0032EFCDF3